MIAERKIHVTEKLLVLFKSFSSITSKQSSFDLFFYILIKVGTTHIYKKKSSLHLAKLELCHILYYSTYLCVHNIFNLNLNLKIKIKNTLVFNTVPTRSSYLIPNRRSVFVVIISLNINRLIVYLYLILFL